MKLRVTLLGALVLAAMLLLVAVLAVAAPAGGFTTDFGDAPDGTNAQAYSMSAYPGVPASFPTAFQRGLAPYGPSHTNNPAFFILGAGYSAEEAAESGADNDFDGINNIVPSANVAGGDGLDDGLLNLPDTFRHCQPVTLTYRVTVLSTYAGPIYANLWADWNHDGAWGGRAPGACPEATTAPEWILQNESLDLSAPGTYDYDVTFTPWYTDARSAAWIRLSVGEQPAGADGSGPADGYALGETEDYLLPGAPLATFLPLIHGGAATPPPPPPPDPDTHTDPHEPPAVLVVWGQLPPNGATATVPQDGVVLRLENSGDFDAQATIDLTIMANGTKELQTIGPVSIQAGGYMTDFVPIPSLSGLRSPGTMLAEVHVFPRGGGQGGDPTPYQPFDVTSEQIYFHESTAQPGNLVIYDEDGYRAQIQALAFVDNQDMWDRLSAGFPGSMHPGLSQIISYVHGDPVLMEPEPDEGHDADSVDDGLPPLDSAGSSFTLCLEWYTAPTDNNMGEDYGRNDDGWRARGALVRVYYSGVEVFDGYLNSAGCANIGMSGASGGLAHIEFDGRALLTAGDGFNILRRTWAWVPPDEPVAWTAAVQINGVQSGATYRPEIWNNDAFSVLSYAAQERFNGGENGNTLYLIKANCSLDPDKSSCSTIYDGRHAIFVKSTQWRRKFVITHEWGHKILSWAASYSNDCTFGGDSHGLETTEYGSCAAMEGWAHYVAVDVWNSHSGVGNPGAKFVYWNGNVYDVELQFKACYDFWNILAVACDNLGVEKDWMRFWWDFHTNSNPGTAPHHAQLFDIIDDVDWSAGPFAASDAFLDVLNGTLNTRWDNYACWNGIAYDNCQ